MEINKTQKKTCFSHHEVGYTPVEYRIDCLARLSTARLVYSEFIDLKPPLLPRHLGEITGIDDLLISLSFPLYRPFL